MGSASALNTESIAVASRLTLKIMQAFTCLLSRVTASRASRVRKRAPTSEAEAVPSEGPAQTGSSGPYWMYLRGYSWCGSPWLSLVTTGDAVRHCTFGPTLV